MGKERFRHWNLPEHSEASRRTDFTSDHMPIGVVSDAIGPDIRVRHERFHMCRRRNWKRCLHSELSRFVMQIFVARFLIGCQMCNCRVMADRRSFVNWMDVGFWLGSLRGALAAPPPTFPAFMSTSSLTSHGFSQQWRCDDVEAIVDFTIKLKYP